MSELANYVLSGLLPQLPAIGVRNPLNICHLPACQQHYPQAHLVNVQAALDNDESVP